MSEANASELHLIWVQIRSYPARSVLTTSVLTTLNSAYSNTYRLTLTTAGDYSDQCCFDTRILSITPSSLKKILFSGTRETVL